MNLQHTLIHPEVVKNRLGVVNKIFGPKTCFARNFFQLQLNEKNSKKPKKASAIASSIASTIANSEILTVFMLLYTRYYHIFRKIKTYTRYYPILKRFSTSA